MDEAVTAFLDIQGGHLKLKDKCDFSDISDWPQFLTIQTSKWLDMATNWTMHSSPDKVLVVHYENLKTDLKSELRKILTFLNLPVDDERCERVYSCVLTCVISQLLRFE